LIVGKEIDENLHRISRSCALYHGPAQALIDLIKPE
jgi:hypothetical protein